MSDRDADDLSVGSSSSTSDESATSNELDESDNVDVSNAQSVEETTRGRCAYHYSLCAKMYIICREICFLVLLVLSYAAFNNHGPKISKSPVAYPFFPESSVVMDFYRGELSEAIEMASDSEIAFVMFYAPWDAESQTVRKEFDEAAHNFHGKIHFSAINCWQPGSECQQEQTKVYPWPVLIAYRVFLRGVPYHGPRTASHMTQFLLSLSKPLARISTSRDLKALLGRHEVVVAATLDIHHHNHLYNAFYTAAIKYLEYDPQNDVKFAVETTAHVSNSIKMFLWNETVHYPSQNWDPDAVTQWISKQKHQIVSWITFPESKSTVLSKYLSRGPAILVFTPRNPLVATSRHRLTALEAALEYYDCQHSLEPRRKLVAAAKRELDVPRAETCKYGGAPVTVIGQYLNRSSAVDCCMRPPNSRQPPASRNISGMACRGNATLSFALIDSLRYHHFAQALGIDLNARADKTALVILDSNVESHFVMSKALNGGSIREFIARFADGKLKRDLVSVRKSLYTHKYTEKWGAVKVRELSSESFVAQVVAPRSNVLVLYYGNSCAYCSQASISMLNLAHVTRRVCGLSYTRINGDKHGLAWQYTMNKYPTVIVFPAAQKGESRAFSQNLQFNVHNLLMFLLGNVDNGVRFHVFWAVCQRFPNDLDVLACAKKIRVKVLQRVNELLLKCRKVTGKLKRRALHELSVFRDLNFLLVEPVKNGDKIHELLCAFFRSKATKATA